MERWKADAGFVLEKQHSETKFLFREDSDHTERRKHDEFVREWGFSSLFIMMFRTSVCASEKPNFGTSIAFGFSIEIPP